jgi:hypothetical protein
VLHEIGRLIDRLLNTTAGRASTGDLGVIAVVVVVVVVAAVIVWRVGVPARAAAAQSVFALGAPVSASDHRLRSEQAGEAGDWNTAVVERMRAIARELEESGAVEVRAGRTATELAEDGAALLPAAASGLRACARTFNDVAYGARTADQAALAGLITTDETIRATARDRLVRAQ